MNSYDYDGQFKCFVSCRSLCTTAPWVPNIEIFEGWQMFKVVNLNSSEGQRKVFYG